MSSECECDGQSSQGKNDSSASHYNLRDDGSEEAMHPAVSLGDLGEHLECEESSCNSPLKLSQKRSQKG